MTHQEAAKLVSRLINFCEENGFGEWVDDLYSLLDNINEEINEQSRTDNQG